MKTIEEPVHSVSSGDLVGELGVLHPASRPRDVQALPLLLVRCYRDELGSAAACACEACRVAGLFECEPVLVNARARTTEEKGASNAAPVTRYGCGECSVIADRRCVSCSRLLCGRHAVACDRAAVLCFGCADAAAESFARTGEQLHRLMRMVRR